jgi:tetratricopeptide (TPR) repeat protein
VRALSQARPGSDLYRACLDTSLTYIESWRAADSATVDPIALDGDVRLARGDTNLALDKYRLLLSGAPRFEPAYRAIGTILLNRGDTAEAVANYDALLSADSLNVFANVMLGSILLVRRDTAGAMFRFERAASIDTFALLPPLRIAAVQTARGRHTDAADLLGRAVRRVEARRGYVQAVLQSAPDAALYAELKLRLALAMMNLGEWARADEQVQAVLRFAPAYRTARQLADAVRQRTVPSFILW